jgi:hypothetical protein
MPLLVRTIGLLLAGWSSLIAVGILTLGRGAIRFLARSMSACVNAPERLNEAPASPMPFMELMTVVRSARMGTSSFAIGSEQKVSREEARQASEDVLKGGGHGEDSVTLARKRNATLANTLSRVAVIGRTHTRARARMRMIDRSRASAERERRSRRNSREQKSPVSAQH